MDCVLWIAQVLLAVIYGIKGWEKLFSTDKLYSKTVWAEDESPALLRIIGASELFGAAGMVLPLQIWIFPWLVPIVAIGFAFIQLLAILTVHLPRNEFSTLPLNISLLVLSIFVAVGRWELIVLSFPFL